jgi:hypothetical protein
VTEAPPSTHVGSITSLAPAGSHVYLVDVNHYRIRRLDRDAAPPDTALTAHPPKYSNVASASFEFASTQDGSSFSCKLDGADWSSCTSPEDYDGLPEGAHVFRVRATNAFGETDPIPAKFSWTVDLTPPETTITSHPDKSTTATSATFEFVSSEAASKFKCKLDDGAYETCASPKTYDGLAVGAHVFKVFAIDRAGNRDGTAAVFKWTITP